MAKRSWSVGARARPDRLVSWTVATQDEMAARRAVIRTPPRVHEQPVERELQQVRVADVVVALDFDGQEVAVGGDDWSGIPQIRSSRLRSSTGTVSSTFSVTACASVDSGNGGVSRRTFSWKALPSAISSRSSGPNAASCEPAAVDGPECVRAAQEPRQVRLADPCQDSIGRAPPTCGHRRRRRAPAPRGRVGGMMISAACRLDPPWRPLSGRRARDCPPGAGGAACARPSCGPPVEALQARGRRWCRRGARGA